MCNAVRVKTSFHQTQWIVHSKNPSVGAWCCEGILNMGVTVGGTDKLFGLENVIGF